MSKNFMRPRLLLLAALVSSLTTAAWADTFTVTRTNNTGPGSLPVAINTANATPGQHTIEFSVTGVIELVSPLPLITNSLTINGRSNITVSGGFVSPIFSFAVGTTNFLSGLTLRDAYRASGNGAGISNAGTLVVSGCVLANNDAATNQGGAIYSVGPVTLVNSLLATNRAAAGGGAFTTSALTVASSMFSANQANNGDAGGLYSSGPLTVADSAFGANSVVTNGSGGAIHVLGTASISNSTFTNNWATNGNGGGVFAAGTLVISNSVVSANVAGNGGGLHCLGPTALISIVVSSNRAVLGFGGGLYTAGSLTLERSALVANRAQGGDGQPGSGGGGGGAGLGGGWFHTNGVAALTNCSISGNVALGGAGGASSANTVGGNGGGNDHGIAGIGSSGSGSSGGFGGGGGGGNFRASFDNIGGGAGFGGGAGGRGGNFSSSVGESADGGSGYGGGLFIIHGTATLINCTIASNTVSGGLGRNNGVGIGGGTYGYSSSSSRPIVLLNTIIGTNTAATSSADMFGTNYNSAGFNLIGNNQGVSGLSVNDYQNEPPNIGPLQDNGGGTLTHALLANSLAVGAGTSVGAPTTDQRGVIRPPGQVDIGAFQLVTKVIPTLIWATPADITYLTALGSAQLNANAGISGTYAYTPGAGTVLNTGSNQTLSVLFSPSDTINYLPASNTVRVNVRKAEQTTSFGSLPNRQIGDAPFILNATASSGLPVTFSLLTGSATLVGNVVTLGSVQGSVIIRASQAGNSNYNAAPDVDQTFFLGTPTFPVISQHPANQSVVPGDRVVFTVGASGAPLNYQWQFKGTNLPGETGNSLTLQRVTSGLAGPYNVIVSNPGGTVVSTIATLNVNVSASAPAITSQPLNQTVTAGNAVTLSVTATGSGLTYQWHLGTSGNTNVPVPSATGAAYTTPVLTTNVNYWVVVRNAFGLVDSATASLSVQPVTGAATLGLNMLAGLTIDGTAGGNYRLEYATNAVSTNWVALTNLTLPSSRHYFADWDSTNAVRRFYRVVVP